MRGKIYYTILGTIFASFWMLLAGLGLFSEGSVDSAGIVIGLIFAVPTFLVGVEAGRGYEEMLGKDENACKKLILHNDCIGEKGE